ncbi:hypothetical protein L7F22_016459 [Adiantum nelumboides]|nr:hypothetical protein [Adiantum nelumboides]
MVCQAKELPLLEHLFRLHSGDNIQSEENFRIPRSCFAYLCDLLRSDLQQKSIPQQIVEAVPSRTISVEKKVAMSLHLLGVGGPVHNVVNTYDLGRSTVGRVLRQFVAAML